MFQAVHDPAHSRLFLSLYPHAGRIVARIPSCGREKGLSPPPTPPLGGFRYPGYSLSQWKLWQLLIMELLENRPWGFKLCVVEHWRLHPKAFKEGLMLWASSCGPHRLCAGLDVRGGLWNWECWGSGTPL